MANDKQYGLFQPLGFYETAIFNQAKKSKEIVQDCYNKFSFTQKLKEEVIGILNIKVDIDQIRDIDSPTEPSTPKMFIWQFIPTVTLIIDNDEVADFNKEPIIKDFLQPKIIPKWINTLFTTKSFSKGDFLMFTKQYFTLELILKLLSQEKRFISRLDEEIEKNKIDKLVIFFDCKFFPDQQTTEPEALIERDILYKINNFNSKIKSIQKNNWYFIGSYDDFTSKNDLLLELDNNEFIKKKKKELKAKEDPYSFVESFQNDYLFLNNAEFYQQNCNTNNWNQFIPPPNILDKTFSNLDPNKFFSNEGGKRELYVYIKKEDNASFFRNDILFPNKKITEETLIDIISIAKEFKND